MKNEKTSFGYKSKGNSKYVIVAPHAAGDDLKSGEISQEIANLLNSSLVVNDSHVKPTNASNNVRSESQRKPVCDFNNIPRGNIFRIDAMSDFYKHINEFSIEARKNSSKQHDHKEHAVVVYIHSMKDEEIGVDIGIGAKYHQNTLKSAKSHPQGGRNSGVIRTSRILAQELRRSLRENLDMDVTIGRRFAAWSRENGIQFHKGSPDHSIQLEISHKLRQDENYKETANQIAKALQSSYESL
tara:strand:- start:3342 stop:4067 length:726 start_codon:yes stop_codon:yes gene_type:complete